MLGDCRRDYRCEECETDVQNSEKGVCPVETVPIDETISRLKPYLEKLGYREREVINLRYGLGDGHCYSLEEVGHIFRVTRERIRLIEEKTVRKVRIATGSVEPNRQDKFFEELRKSTR